MQRFDTVALAATRTAEGFIRDAPVVGRTGILHYKNADGTDRYEYRPPEEAFDAESLASLMGKPITIGHKAMVNANNAAAVAPIGTVLTGGRQDGDTIRADIVIYDLPTDARELSCGYTLELDETPGVAPDGTRYDAVQRKIRYNHVAVVRKGRAGIARLNMDGSQESEDEGERNFMEKVRIDGLEYEAAPEVVRYISKLEEKARADKAEADKAQAKMDALEADLKKEKEAHAADVKAHEDAFDAKVKERIDLLDTARKFRIEKADAMDDASIKKAVIASVRKINLDGKSAEYINAAYDLAKADAEQRDDSMGKQRKELRAPKENREDEYDLDVLMKKLREDEASAFSRKI